MANTNVTYSNPYKDSNKTRYKVNNDMLRVMAQNPTLGLGYIVGTMLGNDYWNNKRNKRAVGTDLRENYGSVTNDQVNQYIKAMKNGASKEDALRAAGIVAPTAQAQGATPAASGGAGAQGGVLYQGKTPRTDFDSANKALDTYTNNGGKTEKGPGSAPSADNFPRTPQQSNQKSVANGGGAETLQQAWDKMKAATDYNTGNTPTGYAAYNGVRDQGNVIGGGAAPAADNFPRKPGNMPTPYTDDQLRQIAAQNFTQDELSRMATPDELRRMNALISPAPAPASAPAQSDAALLAPVADAIASGVTAAAAPESPAAPVSEVPAATAAPVMPEGRYDPTDSSQPAAAYDYVPGYEVPADLGQAPAATVAPPAVNGAGGFNDAMRGYGYDPEVVALANAAPVQPAAPAASTSKAELQQAAHAARQAMYDQKAQNERDALYDYIPGEEPLSKSNLQKAARQARQSMYGTEPSSSTLSSATSGWQPTFTPQTPYNFPGKQDKKKMQGLFFEALAGRSRR